MIPFNLEFTLRAQLPYPLFMGSLSSQHQVLDR